MSEEEEEVSIDDRSDAQVIVDALTNKLEEEGSLSSKAIQALKNAQKELERERADIVEISDDSEAEVELGDDGFPIEESDEELTGSFATDSVLEETAVASGLKTVKEAQTAGPLNAEPTDGVQEERETIDGSKGGDADNELNVPRDESKAKPEIDPGDKSVNTPTEVRDGTYETGPGATDLHTNVVPRDGSGDGLGGSKPKFDTESGDQQTSGNPDSYVQELQTDNVIDPTPAGNAENHATASADEDKMKSFACARVASAQGIDAKELEAVIGEEGSALVQHAKSGKYFKVQLAKKKI